MVELSHGRRMDFRQKISAISEGIRINIEKLLDRPQGQWEAICNTLKKRVVILETGIEKKSRMEN
jgi:hypothetical protein